MAHHPMTAATRPSANPWHAAAGTGPAPDLAPLRRLQAAFPSCWLHRDTAQALLDAVRVHTLAPGPLTLSPRDQPPAWWLVADGRIVAGDTGARADETLQRAMGSVMADRVRQLAVDRHALATKDVTARLASWLLRQLPVAADDTTAITLREQKRSIARQLVMAQETLSRCFRRLVDLGCIEVKGYIVTVRDLRALQTVAASPAA